MKSGTIFALVTTLILLGVAFIISISMEFPHCPYCDVRVTPQYDNYCPHCGHQIDSLIWYSEKDKWNNEILEK